MVAACTVAVGEVVIQQVEPQYMAALAVVALLQGRDQMAPPLVAVAVEQTQAQRLVTARVVNCVLEELFEHDHD